mmetsp:Transcript_4896/g.15814  ORF Transcript_4896/g.15814 Transcript_4896/m.15814 type:complete len:153 (+) Transcript_4896:2035-2493(+)
MPRWDASNASRASDIAAARASSIVSSLSSHDSTSAVNPRIAASDIVWSLVVVPAAARIGTLVGARFLPPLRPGGLGGSIAGATRVRDMVGWGLVLAGSCMGVSVLIAVPLVLAGLGLWFRARLGGMTGDVHGAGIELAESTLLALAVVYAAL